MLRRTGTKIFTTAVCLLLLCFVTNASASQTRHPSFYASAGFGLQLFDSLDSNIIENNLGGPFDSNISQNGHMINSSYSASVALGYTFPISFIKPLSLSTEMFINYSNTRGIMAVYYKQPSLIFRIGNRTEIKLREYVPGVDFKPAIEFAPNQFLYAILGATLNRLKMTVQGEAGQNTGRAPLQTIKNQSVVGLRIGFGLEELLTHQLGIFMHYVWTDYGQTTLYLRDRRFARFYLQNSIVNLQTHDILLGIKYYFSPQNYSNPASSIRSHFKNFFIEGKFGLRLPDYASEGVLLFGDGASRVVDHQSQQGIMTPTGSLGLGYAILSHHFYWGLEALLNVSGRGNGSSERYFNLARQWGKEVYVDPQTVEAAFDMLFGVTLSRETLLVSRVGIAINHVHLKVRTVLNPGNAAGDIITVDQNVPRAGEGFRVGLGIQRFLTKNLALSISYMYTYYGHIFASNVVGGGSAPANSLESQARMRIGAHSATMGIVYYFYRGNTPTENLPMPSTVTTQ